MSKIEYDEFTAVYERTREFPDDPDKEAISGWTYARFVFVREPFPSYDELWEFAKEFERKDFDVPDIHEKLVKISLEHKVYKKPCLEYEDLEKIMKQ